MKALLLSAASSALVLAVAAPAAAQDTSGIDWTVQLGANTDYVSKGVSKSNGDPSVWGRVEGQHGDLFAGGFLTSADTQGANAEAQLYVGWRPEAFGYEWEFATTYKAFPGSNPGVDDDLVEFRADASRAIGPVSGRLRVEYTPDNAGPAKQAWWVEGRASWKFRPTTSASIGLGRREQELGADYTAWNVGLTQKFGDHLSGDLRWYDTDGHAFGDNYEGRLVAGITATF